MQGRPSLASRSRFDRDEIAEELKGSPRPRFVRSERQSRATLKAELGRRFSKTLRLDRFPTDRDRIDRQVIGAVVPDGRRVVLKVQA